MHLPTIAVLQTNRCPCAARPEPFALPPTHPVRSAAQPSAAEQGTQSGPHRVDPRSDSPSHLQQPCRRCSAARPGQQPRPRPRRGALLLAHVASCSAASSSPHRSNSSRAGAPCYRLAPPCSLRQPSSSAWRGQMSSARSWPRGARWAPLRSLCPAAAARRRRRQDHAQPVRSRSTRSCAQAAAAPAPLMKVVQDDTLAYAFEYPAATSSGRPLPLIVARKPERYSSAAPLTADARQRIVFELADLVDAVTVSVTVCRLARAGVLACTAAAAATSLGSGPRPVPALRRRAAAGGPAVGGPQGQGAGAVGAAHSGGASAD